MLMARVAELEKPVSNADKNLSDTESDQKERNKDQVCVYVTPNNPTTCPVLALGC